MKIFHLRFIFCVSLHQFVISIRTFQLELECSKCVPMKLTNEIQIQYHTNKFHWSISFEETILEHSNSVPMFQLHNTEYTKY